MKLERIVRPDGLVKIATEYEDGKFAAYFNGNTICPATSILSDQLVKRNNAFEPGGAINDIKNILLVTQLDMDNGYSGKTADGLREAIAKLQEVYNG